LKSDSENNTTEELDEEFGNQRRDKVRKESFTAWLFDNEVQNLEVLQSKCRVRAREEMLPAQEWPIRKKFAEYHGVKYGLPVNNGTVSLEIALKAGRSVRETGDHSSYTYLQPLHVL
jgi:hypothetical protein